MKIQEIYEKYKIMPQLQTHQLRVAAVGRLIVENFRKDIDVDAIVTACLIHDMGNIIKFNLKLFPEYNEPEGYDYWKSIQDEFISKYGNDEHEATILIAKEIGVSKKVQHLIESIGFSKSVQNSSHDDYEVKIVAYADYRVGINGILSLEERLSEGRKRFANRQNKTEEDQKKISEFDTLAKAAKRIEDQIFKLCEISSGDINDSSVEKIIPTLELA